MCGKRAILKILIWVRRQSTSPVLGIWETLYLGGDTHNITYHGLWEITKPIGITEHLYLKVGCLLAIRGLSYI